MLVGSPFAKQLKFYQLAVVSGIFKIDRMKRLLMLCPVFVLLVLSCKKTVNDFPPEPEITHVSTSPQEIHIFDTSALIQIKFHFTDGDGDIGLDPSEQKLGIFLKDSRDTTQRDSTLGYPFPYIDPSIRPKGGLEGVATVKLGREYFLLDSLHTALGSDTMVWYLYIQDDSGTKSNVIHSDTIYIKYE